MAQQMTEPQTSDAACSGQTSATAQGFLFSNSTADAATLYENLLTIQNAADLQWTVTNPANVQVSSEFRLDTFLHATKSPYLFVLWLSLFLLPTVMADLPKGSWSMSGDIVDVAMSSRGPGFTNTFSLTGYYDNGRFQLNLTPLKTINDNAESVGWDGKLLYLIQRWSDIKNVNASALRTNSLAFVEPSVFSHRASFALQSVLSAFADSNLLSSLENGKISVILGEQRIYPEENNTYKVKHLSSCNTEIEAFSPGLELGEKGLVPVRGFEQGFKRWTQRSNFTNVDSTNILLLTEYNRFSPVSAKLVQDRAVTAKISFHSENQDRSVFFPAITEKSLTVLDYSSRYEILPWTKGTVEWYCRYKLTNQNWDFDTNFISAQVRQFKTNMILMHGYPKDLLAKANTVSAYQALAKWQIRRAIILCVLIGFSVLCAGMLWFGLRQAK
ncbi:MAG TPA: hypothetical protein VIK59_09890 [Verrucomicrobiae bacterium]